ncbi:MAG TPA: TfoX/Sxy family protein [Thermoplasmata archaeon]|nr:TfoX/Sxy family protein [Thermoplasmata archaeon]
MKLPRLDPETRRFYDRILPADGRIQTRSMFGGLGSFVNGNMFAGALGKKVFLKLPEPELRTLLKERGGGPFEPVTGHAMAGYATLPESWMKDVSRAKEWARKAFVHVGSMPPKKGKKS